MRFGFVFAFVVSVLSLPILSGTVMAEGKWQKAEGRRDCAVWNPYPQPQEKIFWTGQDCEDGKAQGTGVLVWEYIEKGVSKRSIYIGEMYDGKYDGYGQSIHSNGSYHKGLYEEGKPLFYEEMGFANGDIYDGHFGNGKPNGSGVMRYSGGGWYDGDFKAGKRHGKGVWMKKSGSRFEGTFRDDKLHGSVMARFKNGVKFKGFFEEGFPDGYGEMLFSNGSVCVGNYTKGYKLHHPGRAHHKKDPKTGTCEKKENTTHFIWD